MGFLSLTVGLARLQLAYTPSYTPAVKSVSPLLTLNLFAVQVKQFVSGNRPQEAGWMIARVAQRDVQPAIIHPAWLAY